jgi:dihydrodipicolinate synthase/N-acetylneuraminate lyase
MTRIWKLVTLLFADTNPVPCKAALAELGLCRPEPRLPLGAWRGPSFRPVLAELGLA